MSYSDVLLFDPGVSQWRCGRAEEEGPDVILPGIPEGDHVAWQQQVRAGIEALEADPTECAMIMSEPPATTAAQRAERAAFLFELGLQAVHFAAGLVLAMYDVSFDTGMIIDVGESAAYLFAICDGLSVLEAATRHPLTTPGGAEGGAEAGAEAEAEAGAAQLPGVIDAIVRTLGTVDTSLHASLVGHIALVGGGSMAASFAAQLERLLCDSMIKAPPLAVPQLGSCAPSERAWRLWAARHSREEAGPLRAQPAPRVLEPAASKAADFTASDPNQARPWHWGTRP